MITSIQITTETREQLKNAGKKGETYEQIIIRLLQEHETNSEARSSQG